MDLGLEGARAFVAASSKGLGRAVATELAREGARVTISSRSEEHLAEAREYVLDAAGTTPESVRTVQCDLLDVDQIRATIEETVDIWDGLDVLVTNHGGTPAVNFQETGPEHVKAGHESVVRSTYTLAEAALPAIRESGGSMAHVAAATALESPRNHFISNTMRPAIFGISKSISNEYAGEGVRSNTLCPRGIMTDRLRYKINDLAERRGVSFEEAKSLRETELPVNRLGEPEEFGKAVAFVVSDVADFITGATIPVDGGWRNATF